MTESLNLAAYYNSPDRSTKSTTSHLNVLCVLVNTRFQVLFHSPPGVLFTFPSQYFSAIGHQVVFRLGGWSPRLLTGFLVSADTKDTVRMLPRFVYRTLTVSGRLSHAVRLRLHNSTSRSIPRKYYYFRFCLLRFRSPLLAESRLISFPPGTSMFQFPGFPAQHYGFMLRSVTIHHGGFPIRKSTDRSLFAAPRGLSQLVASFFGS